MTPPSIAVTLAMLQLAAAAPPPQERWILRCEVGAPDMPATRMPAVRTFRVGPGLLQEWKASDQAFGQNLCLVFPCKADRQRLEGTISSSSLMLTLRLDRKARTASWRTVGASGMARTSGPCAAQPETNRG